MTRDKARQEVWGSPDVTAMRGRDPLDMTVLVVYASRHGATREIAARIADRLADAHCEAVLRQVDEVDTPEAYDAVVLGAPVYDQSWPPEANRFVDRHRDALAARPLWLFSVGSFDDTKRLIGPVTHREPAGIEELRGTLRPRDYRVFAGVIAKDQWPFWSRVLFHALGGRPGDHRNWPVIDAWAEGIARALPALRSTAPT
jgi:menaquinone-dependent protoporphyrinogen oxidase